MPEALQIAVFKAEAVLWQQILPVFQRPSQASVHMLGTFEELARLSQQQKVDLVAIPLSLDDKTSGIRLCLQLKADERFAATPVFGISPSKDRSILQSFYGAGADSVAVPPFDHELIFFQIGALCRQKRSFDELLSYRSETAGLRHGALAALNSVPGGVLVMSHDQELIFLNQPAALIFACTAGDAALLGEQEKKKIASQLAPFLTSAAAATRGAMLKTVDDRTFPALIDATPLTGEAGETVGYSCSVSDASQLRNVSSVISQAERAAAVSLLLASAAMRLLKSEVLGPPGAPLQRIEETLQYEDENCGLEHAVTILLELLDSLLNPGTSVKVRLDRDRRLRIKRSELLRLLGGILIFSVRQAGPGGETVLSAEEARDGEVVLSVRSISEPTAGTKTNKVLATLLAGSFEAMFRSGTAAPEDPGAFESVLRAAGKYRGAVECRRPSASETVVRVKLPVRE